MAFSMGSAGFNSQAKAEASNTASSLAQGVRGIWDSRTKFPWVRVPVLSTQMTVVDPKVSTAVSLLTRTPFLESLQAPRERNKVKTRGNSSGMAAMVRLTDERMA